MMPFRFRLDLITPGVPLTAQEIAQFREEVEQHRERAKAADSILMVLKMTLSHQRKPQPAPPESGKDYDYVCKTCKRGMRERHDPEMLCGVLEEALMKTQRLEDILRDGVGESVEDEDEDESETDLRPSQRAARVASAVLGRVAKYVAGKTARHDLMAGAHMGLVMLHSAVVDTAIECSSIAKFAATNVGAFPKKLLSREDAAIFHFATAVRVGVDILRLERRGTSPVVAKRKFLSACAQAFYEIGDQHDTGGYASASTEAKSLWAMVIDPATNDPSSNEKRTRQRRKKSK